MNTQALAASWIELKKGIPWRDYATANPGEAQRLDQYVFSIVASSPIAPPTLKTHTGKGLAGTIAALLAAAPPPPPQPGVTPPRDPVAADHRISNVLGLGRNVQSRETSSDYVIDGTGDSAVLFQQNAGGSTASRYHVTRVGALPAPVGTDGKKYPRHPFYVDVPCVELDNIFASCVPGAEYVGQCFSLRYGGFDIDRFYGEGAPHGIGYFNQDSQPADGRVSNGTILFTGDCGIWLDSAPPELTLYFSALEVAGLVARSDTSRFLAHTVWESVTSLGKPLTPQTAAAMLDIPPSQVTIR